MADATGDEGFGVFWRTADAPPPRPATPHRSARAVTSARRLPPLPDKQTTKTISAASPPLANKSISNTPTALLDVLHTLLAGIRRDSLRFSAGVLSGTIHLTGGRKGVDRNVTRQSNTYLPPPPGVQAEDREFFDEQQALAADREGFFAATTLARKRHCAIDDKQAYSFDRSSPAKKLVGSRLASVNDNLSLENRIIERQRRKIEHLIHVLQTEIAIETRRAITVVGIQPDPGRPVSRQSQHTLADIVKDRCEAADRVMRILEEYRVVVGADAVRYLQQSIADSKGVVAQTT